MTDWLLRVVPESHSVTDYPGSARRTASASRRTASRSSCSASRPAARASTTSPSRRSPRSARGVGGGIRDGGRPDADLRGPADHLVGQRQRRQTGRDAVQHRRPGLLRGLQRLPVALHLVGVLHVEAGEHVRVPVHQLVHDAGGDVVDGEAAGLLRGDPGVEVDLEQQVAELLAQVGVLRWVLEPLDGLDRLVGLLEEVPRQRTVGLLPVPGALAAEPVHDGDQVEQAGTRHVVRRVQHLDLDGCVALDQRGGQAAGERLRLRVVGQPHDVLVTGDGEQGRDRRPWEYVDRVTRRRDRAGERCVSGGGQPSRGRGDRGPRGPGQQPGGDPRAGDQEGQGVAGDDAVLAASCTSGWPAARRPSPATGRGCRRRRRSSTRPPRASRSWAAGSSWCTRRTVGPR